MCKLKICGLSRLQDIEAANRWRPDYIGFVFAPSRRQINATQAAQLKEHLDKRIITVGVFVDAELDFICQLYFAGLIDWIQLHGSETTAYLEQLRQLVPAPIIKAIAVGSTPPPQDSTADYLLFDTASKIARGGTGQVFDWQQLKTIKRPYFLAGGINAANVVNACRQLRPYCLDVSSGVETDGYKDEAKIRHLIEILRGECKYG